MPSIYSLKPAFQNLLRPLVNGLARIGVTANQVTLAGLLLSLIAGAMIASARGGRTLLLLPAVLFVRMALNAMDGMLAREHGQKTSLGALLNELGDVIADTGLYLPLALVPGFDPRLITGIVILSILTEMTGVIAVQIGASRRYDGPLGKSDRAFVFGLLGLLLGLRLPVERAIPSVLWAMLFLLAVTIVNRARRALRSCLLELRSDECPPHPSPGERACGGGARDQRRAGALAGLPAGREAANLLCESHQPPGLRGAVVSAAGRSACAYPASRREGLLGEWHAGVSGAERLSRSVGPARVADKHSGGCASRSNRDD